MRILFACGGTAGHINPAVAVASQILEDYPDAKILFAGNPARMEATLVPKAGFDFVPIMVEGLQRKLNWVNIQRNAKAAWYLLKAGRRAKAIITSFAPDIVVGTGGYVSAPVLRTAAKMGIPTLTHESNAYPGLTTKMLSRHVDKILLAVKEAQEYLPKGKNYTITGNPVRSELLEVDRSEARETLGVGNRVCILSLGGSNGAEEINRAIAQLMGYFQPSGKTHHIHATGQYGVELMPKLLQAEGVNAGDPHLDIREYIYDMEDCFAAADLVICRSGAMTLTELQAVGKASILIPSPNVAENHQYRNAMVLANNNAAIIIEEKELSGDTLISTVEELVNDPQELKNLSRNAASMGILDGAKRICNEIYELLNR